MGKIKLIGAIVVVLIALQGALVLYWSVEPDLFNVQDLAATKAYEQGVEVVTGYTSVVAATEVVETLLNKRGGYISNDIMIPFVFMDDMPAWEFGAIVQIRDFSRALRKDFSRSQTQSMEDKDLAEGEPHFFFDHAKWIFPSTESQYEKGLEHFYAYSSRLADPTQGDAQFYARADNLNNWLGDVSARLGSLSKRLSGSVARVRSNIDLAGDSSAEQATATSDNELVKTPWLELDDVFYEARGSSWALINLLNAAVVDYRQVLEKKNAVASLEQIIRDLEATQDTMWSPMVLNGDGFGLVANHSLVMANYISRANAAILDLRELLSKG